MVCGAQALALIVLVLLRRSTRLLYNSEQDVDAVLWERGGVRRTLLEENDWQHERDDFEERRYGGEVAGCGAQFGKMEYACLAAVKWNTRALLL